MHLRRRHHLISLAWCLLACRSLSPLDAATRSRSSSRSTRPWRRSAPPSHHLRCRHRQIAGGNDWCVAGDDCRALCAERRASSCASRRRQRAARRSTTGSCTETNSKKKRKKKNAATIINFFVLLNYYYYYFLLIVLV